VHDIGKPERWLDALRSQNNNPMQMVWHHNEGVECDARVALG
jgi:hypothetical protein